MRATSARNSRMPVCRYINAADNTIVSNVATTHSAQPHHGQ